jgi:hypothetical protein
MASPSNTARELNERQRSEWEGFGTAGVTPGQPAEAEAEKKPLSEKASDLACEAGHQAERAVGAVGSGMQSLAQNIREHSPESGVVGSAASAVADTLERGGRYLETENLRGMGQDLTNLIRRNPIPALLIGVGLGFLLARATRRSS